MKNSCRFVMSLVLGSACVFPLHAQTPTTPQSNAATAAKITLTGCVERADQMTPSGTAATTVDSQSFVLIHAAKSGTAESRSEAVGTSGTANTAKASMYRLDAEGSTLNPHVGHKVEVTGALDAAGAPATTDPPSAENAPRLKVDTVKMLAETCAR